MKTGHGILLQFWNACETTFNNVPRFPLQRAPTARLEAELALASTLWGNAMGSSGERMAKKSSEQVLQNLKHLAEADSLAIICPPWR
jgi:hypothetical protein